MDTFTGRDLPGTYTCRTARYVGRPFRVKPNRVTTKKVKVKVFDVGASACATASIPPTASL